jgi:hypothetical protein
MALEPRTLTPALGVSLAPLDGGVVEARHIENLREVADERTTNRHDEAVDNVAFAQTRSCTHELGRSEQARLDVRRYPRSSVKADMLGGPKGQNLKVAGHFCRDVGNHNDLHSASRGAERS